MKTLLFFFILTLMASCGVADKIEESHNRLWDWTVCLRIDSVSYNKVYLEDLCEENIYSLKIRDYMMLVGCPDIGDTIFIADHEELLPKFKFEKK